MDSRQSDGGEGLSWAKDWTEVSVSVALEAV